jgi:cell fate (sporulation/competence/biofilm development) regulator YlbF (YheA/YmcA/DUF963 family)
VLDDQADDLAIVVNYWATYASLHKKKNRVEHDDETRIQKYKSLKYIVYQTSRTARKHVMVPLKKWIL